MKSPEPLKEAFFPSEKLSPMKSWEWFKDLVNRSSSYVEQKDDFITANFFLKGRPYLDYSITSFSSELNKTTSPQEANLFIPCSMRITNVQKMDIRIREMCFQLEERFGRTVTCNLYFTPGVGKNCFSFHVDAQRTYICQLLGSKRWFFPLDEEMRPLRHIISENFNPGRMSTDRCREVIVQEGEQLFVPHSLIHKAEIEGACPSLHITFGTMDYHQQDALNYFMEHLLKKAGVDVPLKEMVQTDDLEALIRQLKEAAFLLEPEKVSKDFQKKIFIEQIKNSKFGRSYNND